MRALGNNYLILLCSYLLIACGSPKEKEDTPVSGSIIVYVDEAFRPIVTAEIDAFQNLYTNSKVEAAYQSQNEAIAALLNGKADMIIISRALNKEEEDFLLQKKITVRTNKWATDAIALLANKEYSDSTLSTQQLKDIFSGTIKSWNELSASLPKQTIEIVVDKSTSSNLNYLKDSLDLQEKSVKIFAVGSDPKVLEHVKGNKNSLGIIGFNWISDEDDPDLRDKLKELKVLAIGRVKDETYYQPLQAHLANNDYPLARTLYVIIKASKVGLSTGFATFMLSDPGQRIVLKEGLLPAVMPGREIVITKNNN